MTSRSQHPPASGQAEYSSDLAIDAYGSILVTGTVNLDDPSGTGFFVGRISPDGVAGTCEITPFPFQMPYIPWVSTYATPYCMEIRPAGKILVAGNEMDCDTETEWTGLGLACYNAYDGLSQRLWVEQDANYNVTSIADVTGTVVQRFQEDPYGGNVVVLNGNWQLTTDNYTWLYIQQGGRYDPVAGVIHFDNRDLDPETGTWRTPDPTGYRGVASLYVAMGDSPVGMVDPEGLDGTPGYIPMPGGGSWNPQTGQIRWGTNPPPAPVTPTLPTPSGGATVYAIPPGVPVPPIPGQTIPWNSPSPPPSKAPIDYPQDPTKVKLEAGAAPWNIEKRLIISTAALGNKAQPSWSMPVPFLGGKKYQCDEQSGGLRSYIQSSPFAPAGGWKYWGFAPLGGQTWIPGSIPIGPLGDRQHNITLVYPINGNPMNPFTIDGFYGPTTWNNGRCIRTGTEEQFRNTYPYPNR
jgi:RHS repeat-associated protein